LLNFFLGALDTTVKWLGTVVVVLNRYPEILAEVRANQELLPQAMEEAMRLESVAQLLMRLVREDGTPLGRHVLSAGEPIYLALGVANRDPAVFERPEIFDIHRAASPHLGFGFGFHHCLGVNTARQEVQSFLSVLLDMIPALEVAGCEYGKSWAVWGPEKLWVRKG
jgi:cytochrome P450